MTRGARVPIVGVGASAGGIPAMEGLFKGLPDEPGLAFVIVTHLSPQRESLLHEVLGRYTRMPVIVAEDGMEVERDRVYVMPQNAILTVKNHRLELRRPNVPNRERKPIDIFFSALADDQREYSIGVILSGGDGDGTLGAKRIKECGGVVLAQSSDGSGPRNPDMPQSAISSGVVDVVVSAEQMGEKLISYAAGFELLDPLNSSDGKEQPKDIERARDEICEILRGQSGHDFSGYKTNTFLRRVKRRMQIGQMNTLSEYIELLRNDRAEVVCLFRDLLINVTGFFRDAGAFAALQTMVVPRLFEGKTASDSIRVWVPGCATGEEGFSLGILLREHMDTLSVVPKVQIFATDIDEPALTVARAARYPANLLEGVSAERRDRYFNNEGDAFVLRSEVRELCIFSAHSTIKDPPFSRMDLVSCRNLLIYFGSDIQNRVIPIFHYALKPGGYLFLGSSESVGRHGDLFAIVDKKQRIFQAREQVSPKLRLPLLIGERRRAVLPKAEAGDIAGIPLGQAVETQVLERYAPPHVVVNADGEIVYYSARTGDYLEAPPGAPSRQVFSMVRRGLRLDLRAALREAVTTGRTIIRENIAAEGEDDQVRCVTITVDPMPQRGNSEPLYLVVFDRVGVARDKSEAEQESRSDWSADLERELRDTRERLQSIIEEYETALEEVKSSNEELVSVNEEAQSTNEELEASKEEMQSLNEELNTINAELSGKVEELDRANNDLKNLFDSTEIATVFLDRELVIRSFTPAASSIFSLRSGDVGRPLTDLSTQLDYPEMRTHIEQVFASGEPILHRLARDAQGRYYMARLTPYRDNGARIRGVVVTLVDVTPLAVVQEHQRVLISEMNHRVKNMLAVVASITNRSLQTSSTKEGFANALLGRLNAMSRAYAALSRENWTEVSIEDLIKPEAAVFGSERFACRGPSIKLKPRQALAVGMVIHELCTNAAKHGALRNDGGRIEVDWSSQDQIVRLSWREIGGPPASKPEDGGFGLTLLKGQIEYQLGGKTEISFAPEGFQMNASFPMEA